MQSSEAERAEPSRHGKWQLLKCRTISGARHPASQHLFSVGAVCSIRQRGQAVRARLSAFANALRRLPEGRESRLEGYERLLETTPDNICTVKGPIALSVAASKLLVGVGKPAPNEGQDQRLESTLTPQLRTRLQAIKPNAAYGT